jgi:hypothetical protein
MSKVVDKLFTRFRTLELITDRLESIVFGRGDVEDAVKFEGVDEPVYGSVYGVEIGNEEGPRHIYFSIFESGVNDVVVSHPIRQLIADGVVREATPEEAIYGKEDEA